MSEASLPAPIGRIPVTKVSPVLEGGTYPAKASVGEEFPISARVFREGHDAVAATVVLTSPHGSTRAVELQQIEPWGLDIFETWVRLDELGEWRFHIEGWSDPWGTWLHHAQAKLPEGIDVDLLCLQASRLCTAAAQAAGSSPEARVLATAARDFDTIRPIDELIVLSQRPELLRAMAIHRPRDLVSATPDYPIFCDRPRALSSAWYEFFPRSEGATYDETTGTWTPGTFDDAQGRLEHAAAMGFDVVYLPPIHPIGSAFKKGPNNTLDATDDDPGSPWAIGSPAGGHDAIHPDLGDEAAFARFVARARSLDLEVAIDLALQASPDHPWVTEHPEWFAHRADGSIAYAENPPKKYQDIYPLHFDTDPQGLGAEIRRIVELWISRGVTIFRVDNPHTKPISFWAWLLAEVRRDHPEVLFLAEAFTRPEMMHMLGTIGFQQSYTYFTWRNSKWELETYLTELSKETAAFFRPNFWPNTPDINPAPLHSGNPAAFAIRAALAALLSPSWGIYSGFELCEHALFRSEEYLDSEKYQYRPRDFAAEPNIIEWIATLNRLRRAHPALQQLRRLTFHPTSHPQLMAFSKTDGDDTVVCAVSLDPQNVVEGYLDLALDDLGWGCDGGFRVTDEVSGEEWVWDRRPFVSLTPHRPVHVVVASCP